MIYVSIRWITIVELGNFLVRVFHKAKYGTLDQQCPISSLVHYTVINKEV